MSRWTSLLALAIIVAGTASPQQTVPKSQAAQAGKKTDSQPAAKNASAGTFRGQFHMEIGLSGRLSDSRMMFQDVATCRKYEFVKAPGSGGSFSTDGFFVVTGTVVGKQLRATSSKAVDESESERLRARQSKCSEAK